MTFFPFPTMFSVGLFVHSINVIIFFFQFRDLTTLPVLFELHTVLCSVPASSLFVVEIASVCINFLLSVSQYVIDCRKFNLFKFQALTYKE